jgi:hypothetical protein
MEVNNTKRAITSTDNRRLAGWEGGLVESEEPLYNPKSVVIEDKKSIKGSEM